MDWWSGQGRSQPASYLAGISNGIIALLLACAGLRPAAHPYRVAAIAALVVVGQGRGGACGVPGVVGAGPATVVSGALLHYVDSGAC
jgi:hypothetical protein